MEGCIQCPYHGWEYDGSGNCTRMPSTAFCKGIRVSSLPVCEADGFVWVWPGEKLPDADVPAVTQPPEGFDVSSYTQLSLTSPACSLCAACKYSPSALCPCIMVATLMSWLGRAGPVTLLTAKGWLFLKAGILCVLYMCH